MSGRWRYAGVTEQRTAALKRRADARCLLDQHRQHHRAAMYLGGYSIECKLKSIAMERHRCRTLTALQDKLGLDLRQVKTHHLETLLAELLGPDTQRRLLASEAAHAFRRHVQRWDPQWRYDPNDARPGEAGVFLEAVDTVWNWLGSNA